MLELGRNFDKRATGARIASLMEENGYTIFSLASHIGISNVAISNWRSGSKTPSIEHLITLSDLFNVPVDEILVRRIK